MRTPGLEKMLAGYPPEPVTVEDIVDGCIRTHGQEWYQENSERRSSEATDIAALLESVVKSEQEVEGLTAIDRKGKWTSAKLRAYVLNRLDLFLNPTVEAPVLEEAERRKLVYEATVDLAYEQFGSVKVWVHDPNYEGSRTVFIDKLSQVRDILGREPVKGDEIKIINVRREAVITTPGPSGKQTWRNQIVADIYVQNA